MHFFREHLYLETTITRVLIPIVRHNRLLIPNTNNHGVLRKSDARPTPRLRQNRHRDAVVVLVADHEVLHVAHPDACGGRHARALSAL